MNFKIIAAAALLATAASASFAADQSVSFMGGDTASFIGTKTLLAGGDDVISFTDLSAGTYDFTLTLSGQYINLSSLSLNGVAGTVSSNGKILFADVEGTAASPYALTLTGVTTNSKLANYSGELSVSAVPEPASVALMLAGLGCMGFVAKRRKQG